MQHYSSLQNIELKGSWLSIGTFDGVHLGHQRIVKYLIEGARSEKVPAVVVTFYPHPARVLQKRDKANYLTSPNERAELLGDLGVDVVITYPFSLKVAHLSAKSFILQLFDRLQFSTLVVGHDFALGRNREGDVEHLNALGKSLDYKLLQVSPYKINNIEISSSQIRSLLLKGNVSFVKQLLGRYYSLYGKVVPGDGRGKKLKIPTANLEIWNESVIPKEGVYICKAYYKEDAWGAVTNIGIRPTFETGSTQLTVETHLLDFDSDIYGENIKLEFIERIRAEIRFEKVEDLIAQINSDILQARNVITN